MSEEFKQLMMFHVLLCETVTPNARYAAVDRDGMLWWYQDEPLSDVDGMWINSSTYRGGTIDTGGIVTKLRHCEFWRETLIEL